MPCLARQDCLVPAKTHAPPSPALRTLAANLETLRENDRELNSQPKIAAAAKINQKTVWRIFNMLNEPTLEQVSKLAAAFELEPWQLLVPNLHPSNRPVLAAESEGIKKLLANIAGTKEALEGYLREGGNTKPGDL